jgi:hypothetical protein
MDLRASDSEVFQGAVVTFSASGVSGGSNYGPVKYQWKTSGGKLAIDGLEARLDTQKFTTLTTIWVNLEAVSNEGVCRASSQERAITIKPEYKPPIISLALGEAQRLDSGRTANANGAICAGDKVNLRVGSADPGLKYQWQSTGGKILSGGNSAVFDTSGLSPGLYTVSVMAEGEKGSAFDSIPIVVSDCSPEAAPKSAAECFSKTITFDYEEEGEGVLLFAHLKGYSPPLGKVIFNWKATQGRIFGNGAIAWFDRRSVLSTAPIHISLSARSEKGGCETLEVEREIDIPIPMMEPVGMAHSSNGPCDNFRRNDATPTDQCKATLKSMAATLNAKRSKRLYVDIQRASGEVEGIELWRGKNIRDRLVQVHGVNPNQVIVRPDVVARSDQATKLEIIGAGEAPPFGPPAVIFAPEEHGVEATGESGTSRPEVKPIGGIKAGGAATGLKFQEEVKGDYPSRIEMGAQESVSLRFIRKLVQVPTTVANSTTEGDRTKVTETTIPLPGRNLEVPLESAMGEGYEPWIKATLSSPTIEITPRRDGLADWRRLDSSPEILWDWGIKTNSTTLLQELKAQIDVEWRPVGANQGGTIRHRLWEAALVIGVDNPVLKAEQVKTATPIFSVAGLASIVVGVYPRKRRKSGAESSAEEESADTPKMMEPAPAPSEAAGGAQSTAPPVVSVRAGREDDETNASHDLVECSVFAPSATARGETLMVQVFAHLEGRSADAEKMALEFDDTTRRRAVKTLSSRVARETELMFHLVISNWRLDDPVQTLVWMGDAESVQFTVNVPQNCKLGAVAGKVTISQASVPIGQISFILKVTEQEEGEQPEPEPLGKEAHKYDYVFISYASPDRDKVLARVQMLEQMGIKYFQDVLSLNPGDRWEQELYKNIDQCDLFLLFWSHHAKESPWVMKEVEYALARKGADANALPEIKPVIIEGPPLVPPPEKLADLHFNDRLIYFFNKK